MNDEKNLWVKLSVIIAFLLLIVTYNANDLNKMENQPIFKFDVDFSGFDNENQCYIEERLIISNIGSPIKQFKSEPLILLNINYESEAKSSNLALIPIKEYYYLYGNPTSNLTGELKIFNSPSFYSYKTPRKEAGNYKKIAIANNNFEVFALENNSSGYIQILRFLKIEYKDIYEKDHKDLYFVDPFGYGTHKLSDEEEEIINEYYDDFYYFEFLDILDLQPNLIYENWFKYVDSSKNIITSLNWEEYY